MTKRLKRLFLAAGLAAVAAFAQSTYSWGTAPTPPDPATMIAHQVARLTALSGYQTSLQTAIENNNTSTIDTLAAQIGTAQGQIADAQAKAAATFYATLSSTQQTKLQTLGMGVPGGFGGPGGFSGSAGPGGRH